MKTPLDPDRPPKPKQCEALRSGKQCSNDATCYRSDFARWVCTTHLLASHLNIQFVERSPVLPTP